MLQSGDARQRSRSGPQPEAIRQALAERPEVLWAVLHLDPCIPRAWRRFEITFRYHASRYEITVENPSGVTRGISAVEVDGTLLGSGRASLPLVNDGATRRVRVLLG
jgi:cellobiose phosphorylase